MKLFNTDFIIESTAGERVQIPINNKVTILTCDSATGKTKLIEFIKMLIYDRSQIKYASIDRVYDKVIVCQKKDEVLNLISKSTVNKIIFIDRFDTMSSNEDIINYMNESSNIFIVAAHKAFKQCGYSTDSMLGLKHDGTNYKAYKLFETPSDYMFNETVLI